MTFFFVPNRLKGEFITENGKGINYQKLKESQLFIEYSDKMAPLLQNVKLDKITENEKKAFFISILLCNMLPTAWERCLLGM